MLINEQLEKMNMTKYRLSKDSGVPQATINDICSGKAELEKCTAGTLFRLAKVLGVSIEEILEYQEEKPGIINGDNVNEIIAALRKRKES